jgi:hypothetical protein
MSEVSSIDEFQQNNKDIYIIFSLYGCMFIISIIIIIFAIRKKYLGDQELINKW